MATVHGRETRHRFRGTTSLVGSAAAVARYNPTKSGTDVPGHFCYLSARLFMRDEPIIIGNDAMRERETVLANRKIGPRCSEYDVRGLAEGA